jgi:Helix-turn-helix domain
MSSLPRGLIEREVRLDILRFLGEGEPLTATALSELIGSSPQVVKYFLAPLDSNGVVRRTGERENGEPLYEGCLDGQPDWVRRAVDEHRRGKDRSVPSHCPRPPKHDLDLVARAILEEVLRRHPEGLTVAGLSLRIVGDPEDVREVETVAEAIQSLRASGLIRYRDDDQLVEPTQAVLLYMALLRSS